MSIKFKLTQYIIIYIGDSELSNVILTSIIEFPSHPNINSNDFLEELKNKYTDIIIYENNKWANNLYSNKYDYLLEKYSNINKIKFEYFLEKK